MHYFGAHLDTFTFDWPLGKIKSTPAIFEEFSLPDQKSTTELSIPNSDLASFPLALRVRDTSHPVSLESAISSLNELSSTSALTTLSDKHGVAILFRGLPITSLETHSAIAHAFGFTAHGEVGRPPQRTVLAENVKTANEGPPEMPIWLHNECGWSTVNPAWLNFACLAVPKSGGETPITSSIALAAAIEIPAPGFFAALLEKGVRYLYRHGLEDVSNSTVGTSVLGAYGQHVLASDDELTKRAKIEEEVRRHSNDFEWHEDGGLSVTHVVPYVRKHASTGLVTLFGNLTSAFGRSKFHGATEPPFLGDDGGYHPIPTYGDGSAIPTEYLELLLKIAEEEQVLLKWEAGDLVLLDNYAVMHSRQPWVGKRTVLAALWDQEGKIEDLKRGSLS